MRTYLALSDALLRALLFALLCVPACSPAVLCAPARSTALLRALLRSCVCCCMRSCVLCYPARSPVVRCCVSARSPVVSCALARSPAVLCSGEVFLCSPGLSWVPIRSALLFWAPLAFLGVSAGGGCLWSLPRSAVVLCAPAGSLAGLCSGGVLLVSWVPLRSCLLSWALLAFLVVYVGGWERAQGQTNRKALAKAEPDMAKYSRL